MDVPKGEFYIDEGILHPAGEFNILFKEEEFKFYEVVRIIQGIAIFLEDHIARLQMALVTTDFSTAGLETTVSSDLGKLITANNNREGNIKIVCAPQEKKLRLAAYYIPHKYPSNTEYTEGVRLITCHMQRPNPNLKQVRVSETLRDGINKLGHLGEYYEVVLTDHHNYLTEGSKSNIFLLSGETLFTAPDHMVLKGITRQHVLAIVRERGIPCTMKKISQNQLNEFEAGFICGTSPKILPVSSIDSLDMNPKNPIIQEIMHNYNQLIIDYVQQRK